MTNSQMVQAVRDGERAGIECPELVRAVLDNTQAEKALTLVTSKPYQDVDFKLAMRAVNDARVRMFAEIVKLLDRKGGAS